MRTSIITVITTLAATAALAVSAPAMADTWEDTPTGPDGGQGTVVDGTPQAGDEGGGYINEPQSGRGPSTSEWPGPNGATHLRDILRPCTSDADALDGCYDASHDSGLWRSPAGHAYRPDDDGCWTLTPPGGSEPACPGAAPAAPAAPAMGDDAATAEDDSDAVVPDSTVQAPEGDSYSPSTEADAPEALADDTADTADADTADADTADAADSSGDTASDYEEYAADGTRTGLAHTGPASSTIAALAMGVAASAGAGASLMVLARADR